MKSLLNVHFGLEGSKLILEISFAYESLLLIELDARFVSALLFLVVLAFTRDAALACLTNASQQ